LEGGGRFRGGNRNFLRLFSNTVYFRIDYVAKLGRVAKKEETFKGSAKSRVLILAVCGKRFSKILDNVGDTSVVHYFSVCQLLVLFRRYSRLSRDVVKSPEIGNFKVPRLGGGTPKFRTSTF